MATVEQAAATTARLRAALESRDADAFAGTLAPDVVLHSPITAATTFIGVDEVRELLRDVLKVVHDIHYTDDVGDEKTRALFYTATVRGVAVEEATRVRLDDAALITEMTIWFRPLPGLTALMAALGPKLAARQGRAKAALATLMTTPLAAGTKAGDRAAVRLIRPGARKSGRAPDGW
jgi:hypothetical protein